MSNIQFLVLLGVILLASGGASDEDFGSALSFVGAIFLGVSATLWLT